MDTNRHEWSAELLRSFVYLVYFVVSSPGPWTARVSQAAAGASPADSTAHRQLLAGRVSARFSEAVGCGGLPQASGTRGGHGGWLYELNKLNRLNELNELHRLNELNG